MLHSNKGSAVTYRHQPFTPEALQALQEIVISFCESKLAHPDKRADEQPLIHLRTIAENLSLEPMTCAAALHQLLSAIHHFNDSVSTEIKRSSYQEMRDFLQTTCAQIEECEFEEDTAIHCALANLKEHIDYTDAAIHQRKKWGLLHAEELAASQQFFYYWLDAALEISRAIQKGDAKLCLSTHQITRYVDGLLTGCEIIKTKQSPEQPETLAKLPLHFQSVFIRYENRLFYYNKSENKLTEIKVPNQHALESFDQDVSSTSYTLPVTRAMLQKIRDITGFNDHITSLTAENIRSGMSYFTPRNILIALLDGVFISFDHRGEDETSQNTFHDELEKMLSTILVRRIPEIEHKRDATQHNDERNTLEYIAAQVAELTGDASYLLQLPTKQAVQPLMEIGKATSKTELQAMLATCRFVAGSHGIEADRKCIEAIINHIPESSTESSSCSALQVFSRQLPYSGQFTIKRHKKGVTSVESRKDINTAEGNSTSSIISIMNGSSPRKKIVNAAAQDTHLYPHERWKPWQRVLMGIGIGLLVSGIFIGIAAALLYAGPVAHVVLATGIAATVHWAVTVGTVGVVSTLVGLPVVGMAIGFIAGLIWNRKTEKELKTLHVMPAPSAAIAAASPSSSSSGRGLSFGLGNSNIQTKSAERKSSEVTLSRSPNL